MKKIFSIKPILFLTILIIFTFFTASQAKVIERQGAGEVESIEPQNKSITLEIDDVIYMFEINKETTLKGAKSLQDFKKEEEVFVKYKIDEHGRKTLKLLEKKASD